MRISFAKEVREMLKLQNSLTSVVWNLEGFDKFFAVNIYQFWIGII